ncbi:hypothetical protein [Pseudophaeobacter sp.]|uniref:hypothetical protein n=1 Tax=Pseudophaeobacter sp. TaxID=1971739 RepID=UPI003297A907
MTVLAWLSAGIGAIVAVLATVIASIIFGFPLWLSLLLYPVFAICMSTIVFTVFVLRSVQDVAQETTMATAEPEGSDGVYSTSL